MQFRDASWGHSREPQSFLGPDSLRHDGRENGLEISKCARGIYVRWNNTADAAVSLAVNGLVVVLPLKFLFIFPNFKFGMISVAKLITKKINHNKHIGIYCYHCA